MEDVLVPMVGDLRGGSLWTLLAGARSSGGCPLNVRAHLG